jgi:hypothetical protein
MSESENSGEIGDIFAKDLSGKQCASNFRNALPTLYILVWMCEGILQMIPIVNYFRWIWVFVIKQYMHIAEAQLLCYEKMGDDDSLKKGNMSYSWQKFKTFYKYISNFDKLTSGWFFRV